MQWLGAAILGAAAIAAAFFSWGASIVLGATALAWLTLAPARRMESSADSVADLVQELGITGQGHHVPLRSMRLFLPADAHGPYLVPQTEDTIQRDPPASIGLMLDPPGASLLEAWAKEDQLPAGRGVEEAAHILRRALPRLGLADKIHVATGDAVRVTMRLKDPQPALEAEDSGWHLQGGCPASSFTCAIIALALQRPVRTAASHVEPDGTFELEVVPGTYA